ncbi:MAG: hypothetical protein HYZ74_09105, partial [Elusimicrobia bacterium]|nr:hypothetical protein [Elusimicrobiota bacterium]
AEEAFAQLLTDYSTGTYVASALLRRSEVAMENRNWQIARESLERFLQEFPDHKGRSLAEQRLEVVKFK